MRIDTVTLCAVLCTALGSFLPAQAGEEDSAEVTHLAIVGADVHLGTGQVLRRASVLVAGNVIEAVGHDLDLPEGTEIIDAAGKVVTPGYVAVQASGMGTPFSFSKTEELGDSINPFDPSIKMGLAAGITSFLASYEPGTSKPGGKTAVVKLTPGELDSMVLMEDTVTSMQVPLSAAQWRDFRKLVEDTIEHRDAEADAEAESEGEDETTDGEKKKDNKKKSKKPSKDVELMLEVLAGERLLWVAAERSFDTPLIRQALEISQTIGHGVVIKDPVTAWLVADEIAETGSMAVVNPRRSDQVDPARPDETGANIATCAILADAGVAVAVTPPGGRFGGGPSVGTGGILGQDLHTLHLDAAYAVRGGMENHKALRTITLDAARIIGADSRIGSIEPGKDADLLILDGDPLHYRTFVETAIVNGKVAYQKDKEPFYSHIER